MSRVRSMILVWGCLAGEKMALGSPSPDFRFRLPDRSGRQGAISIVPDLCGDGVALTSESHGGTAASLLSSRLSMVQSVGQRRPPIRDPQTGRWRPWKECRPGTGYSSARSLREQSRAETGQVAIEILVGGPCRFLA